MHDGPCAMEAVEKTIKSGFKNISIDLIFGIWDESVLSWKDDLKIAADLPITHVSCYGLTYEPGTFIKECVKTGTITPIPEEKSADMYNLAISYLEGKGFAQYEISNFSKPGFRCKHNYAYWNNDPCTGLGPSAVSHDGVARSENIPDVTEYIKRLGSGINPAGSAEKLSPEKKAKETAAVKIRTMEGIGFDWFKKKTGFELPDLEREALPRLIADGLVEYNKDSPAFQSLCLTRKGILFCDTVSSAFL